MMATYCAKCGREITFSVGADCWIVENQALPPACRDSLTGELIRGHEPNTSDVPIIR